MTTRHCYWTYIMASHSRRLYVGVTNNLVQRVTQHGDVNNNAFTGKYFINKLVYFEEFRYIDKAIQREKQIKGYSRNKKLALIEQVNPNFMDLVEHW